MKNIDFFDFFMGLGLCVLVVTPLLIEITDNLKQNESEQIKQLKQSNIEITQECEVYKNRSEEYENRCLELENIIEGTGLVVDNCECR